MCKVYYVCLTASRQSWAKNPISYNSQLGHIIRIRLNRLISTLGKSYFSLGKIRNKKFHLYTLGWEGRLKNRVRIKHMITLY